MEVAVLDLGSSSFHLVHTRIWPDRSLVTVNSLREVVHLGDEVARTGAIGEAAWNRGLKAFERMKTSAELWRVPKMIAVATGVVRDSDNGGDFVAALAQKHGVEVEVLSREEEGALAYRGARSEFASRLGRFCVIDVGGGSIEIAIGEERVSLWSCSLPLGVLRLVDLLGGDDRPGSRGSAKAGLARLRTAFASAGRAVRGFAPEWLILSSGTARAVRHLVSASGVGFRGQRLLPLRSIRETRHRIWDASDSELLGLGVKPDRITTIPYGVLAIEALLKELDQPEAWVARRGLREGVALRELQLASTPFHETPGLFRRRLLEASVASARFQ